MRPIDADALMKAINQTCSLKVVSLGNLVDIIGKQPTVDAVPRWIPCEERLPKDLEVVNITWINHRPMTYYADIKDKPFTATAIHYEDKWWWYSPICEDMLAECGKSECDKMDADIEVTAWMPLPEPYGAESNKRMIIPKDGMEIQGSVHTADVVEVVRCKDCKRQDNCLKQVVMNSEESKFDVFYKSVGFCSYGERKDDESVDS